MGFSCVQPPAHHFTPSYHRVLQGFRMRHFRTSEIENVSSRRDPRSHRKPPKALPPPRKGRPWKTTRSCAGSMRSAIARGCDHSEVIGTNRRLGLPQRNAGRTSTSTQRLSRTRLLARLAVAVDVAPIDALWNARHYPVAARNTLTNFCRFGASWAYKDRVDIESQSYRFGTARLAFRPMAICGYRRRISRTDTIRRGFTTAQAFSES